MKNTHERIRYLCELAIFIALIIIMTFTPLGYIKTAGLEITLVIIPVIIGAIVLGPKGGLALGLCFGISSFIQCFTGSAFGAALLGINVFGTLFTCIIPRTLMGFLTGLIFRSLSKIKYNKILPYIITGISGALLNTIFFMTSLCLFFYNTEFLQDFATKLKAPNPFIFIILFVGINGLIELGVGAFSSTIISKALLVILPKKTEDKNQ